MRCTIDHKSVGVSEDCGARPFSFRNGVSFDNGNFRQGAFCLGQHFIVDISLLRKGLAKAVVQYEKRDVQLLRVKSTDLGKFTITCRKTSRQLDSFVGQVAARKLRLSAAPLG
mmetsp:Transcript_8715/g.26223  ORF Transcript_8715/g.26223 Transcript_8715/m.26223 type:complete len:113 (+) Transcript_8715:1396-1734(+)